MSQQLSIFTKEYIDYLRKELIEDYDHFPNYEYIKSGKKPNGQWRMKRVYISKERRLERIEQYLSQFKPI